MSTTPNPLFGRKYSLTVSSPASSSGPDTVLTITDSSFEPEALRITFDVDLIWWARLWTAQISIYNPNEQTANFLLTQGNTSGVAPAPNAGQQTVPIQQGMPVTLSAGYQNGNSYGIIWDGFVLQALWEVENQTDFKITLNCVIGLDELNRSPVSVAYNTALTQSEVVQQMAAACYHPIPMGQVTPGLSTKTLPRGKVLFGNPKKYLSEIARDNNSQWWLGQKGLLNIGNLNTDVPSTAAVTYTPTTGIIGTPEQTQLGINMRILMDSRVTVKNPPMCVKVDNVVVRQLLKQVGQFPSLLSQDGTYVVVGTRYRGDTRGQEWYTDVTGWLTANAKLAAISAATGAYLGGG